MKIQSIRPIIQRLKQFISKHVNFKKTVAVAVAMWMLHGIPIHIHGNIIDEAWELLKPKRRGKKDVTDSFVYLSMEWDNNFWRTMQLSYLGKSADGEHLFLGARSIIILSQKNQRLIVNDTVNSLVGRQGLIKKT